MNVERCFKIVLLMLLFVSQTVRSYNNSLFAELNVTDYGEYSREDEYSTGYFEFKYIDSEYCAGLSHCDMGRPPRCACDNLCGVLNDCCPDADNNTELNLTLDQFSCHNHNGYSVDYFMVVTKCSQYWKDNTTRALCENHPSREDTLSRVLVTHKTLDGFIFKNMHCALCNDVSEYTYWNASFGCMEFTDNVSDCTLTLQKPYGKSRYRNCELHKWDIISDCPDNFDIADIKESCEKDDTLLTYAGDDSGLKFKNKYCAYCNGFTKQLMCEDKYVTIGQGNQGDRDFHSYKLLVDYNIDFTPRECPDGETYDFVDDVCRPFIFPAYVQTSDGKCLSNATNSFGMSSFLAENTSESIVHCPLSKLNPGEFQYINKTNQIVFRNEIYNDTEYTKNGSDVFLCINTSRVSNKGRQLQASDKVEQYISLIGLILSIIALVVTIVVYFTFTELLNIPGKLLVSLCFSLLVSQLLFLFAPSAASTNETCTFVAILMHYGFLSAFSWMNVIAFDLLITFSHMTTVGQRGGSTSKKFVKYSVYCLGIPLIIVCIALVLEFAVENDTFRPRYREGACWISASNALLLFFVGPLAVFKLFDVVAFILIVYYITQATRQGAMATNKSNSRSFFIYLKLSLVMGLTWIFAFIANFTGMSVMWYLFIIFNTLQGLLIAISFICTKKVMRLIRIKYSKTKSKYFSKTHSTQETSLT